MALSAGEEIDLTLALQLQAQFEEELRVSYENQQHQSSFAGLAKKPKHGRLDETEQEKLSVSLVDPSWELIDPNPNIHTLFLTFNRQFFWGRLSAVEVRWSPRMTLCAGVCSYEGRGGLCSVRLSVPLLKLRPRKDLIETLLHEMIHAYLFVTANNRDRDGHGPEFHKHMWRINKLAGTNITVYHSFHDEVAVYRQHIWQCGGPCRHRPPYYGLVKRSMNRAPGPNDLWWSDHQRTCGGSYTKIKEPDGYGEKRKGRGGTGVSEESLKKSKTDRDIRDFVVFKGKGFTVSSSDTSLTKADSHSHNSLRRGFSGDSSDKSKNGFYNKNSTHADKFGNSNSSVSGSENGPKRGPLTDIHSIVNNSNTPVFKHVSVAGASNSAVHGFGESSAAAGRNAKNNSSTDKSGRKGSGTLGRGGTTQAVKGFGSRTVVVKGEPPSRKTAKTDKKREESSSTGNFSAFSGVGHTLGSGTSLGQSRLLNTLGGDKLSRNQKSNCNSKATPSQLQQKLSDEHKRNTTAEECCPLCNVKINGETMDEHLDECIGTIDDDFEVDAVVGDPSHINDLHFDNTLSSSLDEVEQIIGSRTGNSSATQSSSTNFTVTKYPCPVCGKHFSEDTMNSHLDSHF